MGKGDRRGKALPKGIAPLAPIKKRGKQARGPNGRGFTSAPQEDARRVALTARAHHAGTVTLSVPLAFVGIGPPKPIETPDIDRAKAQHMGCHIGFVMQHERPNDAPRLWRTWQAWCQAELTYLTRIIGTTGSPKGASIAAIPEKMETDTGHTVDLRTPAERDTDAVRTWMRWRGFIGHMSSADATALHHARREDGPALWRSRKPTRAGLTALAALDKLANIAGM